MSSRFPPASRLYFLLSLSSPYIIDTLPCRRLLPLRHLAQIKHLDGCRSPGVIFLCTFIDGGESPGADWGADFVHTVKRRGIDGDFGHVGGAGGSVYVLVAALSLKKEAVCRHWTKDVT